MMAADGQLWPVASGHLQGPTMLRKTIAFNLQAMRAQGFLKDHGDSVQTLPCSGFRNLAGLIEILIDQDESIYEVLIGI